MIVAGNGHAGESAPSAGSGVPNFGGEDGSVIRKALAAGVASNGDDLTRGERDDVVMTASEGHGRSGRHGRGGGIEIDGEAKFAGGVRVRGGRSAHDEILAGSIHDNSAIVGVVIAGDGDAGGDAGAVAAGINPMHGIGGAKVKESSIGGNHKEGPAVAFESGGARDGLPVDATEQVPLVIVVVEALGSVGTPFPSESGNVHHREGRRRWYTSGGHSYPRRYSRSWNASHRWKSFWSRSGRPWFGGCRRCASRDGRRTFRGPDRDHLRTERSRDSREDQWVRWAVPGQLKSSCPE